MADCNETSQRGGISVGAALETRTIIAISRDGKLLATAAGGQPVRLWDLIWKEERSKEK